MSQRRVVLAVFAVQLVASILIAAGQVLQGTGDAATWFALGGAVVNAALLLAYRYGFEPALQINVALITVIVGIGTPEPYLTQHLTFLILIPPVLALLMAPGSWIIGTAVGVVTIIALRVGINNAYVNDLRTVGQLVIIIGGMYFSRVIVERERMAAERNAQAADAARTQAEQRAGELDAQRRELEARNSQQQQLLDLVATLETPTVSLADHALLAPLVGTIDAQRAQNLTRRLLQDVSAQRARLLVIDIAGVQQVDSTVARSLAEMARAVQLLGCRVAVTGVSPAVALALTNDGIALDGVRLARSPQQALAGESADGAR